MKNAVVLLRIFKEVFLVVLVGLCTTASATVLTYYGRDNGAAAGGARPNSDAAFSAFQAAIGGSSVSSLITFEGLDVGTVIPPGPALSLGLGVTAQATDFPLGIISNTDSTVDGYNITAGGSKFLQFRPSIFGGDVGISFSFPSPINSFGLFVTGSQTPGPDLCPSSCGSLQLWVADGLLAWPAENDVTGGVYFFGFIDTGRTYSQITLVEHGPFSFGPASGSPDIMGVDNITIARVPEPSPVVLLGLGLAILGISRRRAGN
jgi:hypothetical protein